MAQTLKEVIMETQGYLNAAGFPCGTPDGIWGNKSQGALDLLKASTIDASRPFGVNKILWGTKFTQAELTKLAEIIKRLNLPPVMIQDFMSCMAWETGEEFKANTRSPVSSATGLIQFMKATAIGLGTTVEALAKMTQVEQLEYVYLHFKPYAKKISNLGDLYMAIIWPVAVGKPDSYVMWKTGDAQFVPNKGLDVNNDGIILRQECLHKVNNKMAKGAQSKYVKAA